MARYSEEIIDEVRQSNDIVDVISQYMYLKRSGRNYFGLCPFHNEKSPSFSVSPDKQIFHCFGCGVGGNVISFIMKNYPHLNVTISDMLYSAECLLVFYHKYEIRISSLPWYIFFMVYIIYQA